MFSETFAVGCAGVAFHNGVVIVDLVGLSTTDKDDQGRPARELRQRVILTADGAVETFNGLKSMLDKLVEVGVLKRDSGAAAAPPAAPDGGEGGPQSPNF